MPGGDRLGSIATAIPRELEEKARAFVVSGATLTQGIRFSGSKPTHD